MDKTTEPPDENEEEKEEENHLFAVLYYAHTAHIHLPNVYMIYTFTIHINKNKIYERVHIESFLKKNIYVYLFDLKICVFSRFFCCSKLLTQSLVQHKYNNKTYIKCI